MRHLVQLTFYKAYSDLRAEASKAFLGVAWWVIEPILYLTAFYVVFAVIMQRGGPGFVEFLLVGLVVWKWFNASVRSSTPVLQKNLGLMRQVYLPKFVFPGFVLVATTVKFGIVLALLLVFLLVTGTPLHLTWLALPLLIVVQALLNTGVALLLASTAPLVPDLKVGVDNGMILVFFLSGIFFDINDLPPDLKQYVFLNPAALLIDQYRNVLLRDAWPDVAAVGVVLLWGVVTLAVGAYVLRRYDREYPKLVI